MPDRLSDVILLQTGLMKVIARHRDGYSKEYSNSSTAWQEAQKSFVEYSSTAYTLKL
jgi:hypothetical protein